MTTGYANPEVLAETAWLQDHLGDPAVRVVECDEDPGAHCRGHIPGAVQLDWRTDLNDARVRDLVDARTFERLMGRFGITAETSVVLYGDQANWWAAYAYWAMRLFGHERLRLLNGGRKKWVLEGRATTDDPTRVEESHYVVVAANPGIRALRADVLLHIGSPAHRQPVVRLPAGHVLVDVRTPAEFSGRLVQMAGYPQEGALRGGHIPGAANVPWGRAVHDDWTFRSPVELRRLYEGAGVASDKDVVVYCRIGERSAHTWFVLHELMGYRRVRNYDGSWTEWGNSVGLPISNPSLVKGMPRQAGIAAASRAPVH